MTYLESIGIVHRDIAARNILVKIENGKYASTKVIQIILFYFIY